MPTPAEQRKKNYKRTMVVGGTVAGANIGAFGNTMRRAHQHDKAVANFQGRKHNDLAEALRVSRGVNQSAKNVRSSAKKATVAAFGGLAAMGATGLYNEHTYKKAKAGVRKNMTISAFGVDHA